MNKSATTAAAPMVVVVAIKNPAIAIAVATAGVVNDDCNVDKRRKRRCGTGICLVQCHGICTRVLFAPNEGYEYE